MKIIKTYERYTKCSVTPCKLKHAMRIKMIGNVQMDLKILGFKKHAQIKKLMFLIWPIYKQYLYSQECWVQLIAQKYHKYLTWVHDNSMIKELLSKLC